MILHHKRRQSLFRREAQRRMKMASDRHKNGKNFILKICQTVALHCVNFTIFFRSVSKRSSKKNESSHAAVPPTPKTPRSIAKKSLVFSKNSNDSEEDDLNSKCLPKTPKRPRSSIEPVANRLESVFQKTSF